MQNTKSENSSKGELSIAEMFDRIAFRYDFLNSLLSMRQDKRWRKKLVSWLPKGSNAKLLDVACGTGDILQTTLDRRPDYSECVGVDISKEMLKIADKKLSENFKEQKKSLVLKEMSAEFLDLPSHNFDAISIGFGLRNVQNKENALHEFLRVLKPGGSLFILEFFNSSSGLMTKLFRFYFHFILPFIGGLFSDKKAYSYLPRSVENFYSLEEFSNLLSCVGFQQGRRKVFLWGACVLVEAKKQNEPTH